MAMWSLSITSRERGAHEEYGAWTEKLGMGKKRSRKVWETKGHVTISSNPKSTSQDLKKESATKNKMSPEVTGKRLNCMRLAV